MNAHKKTPGARGLIFEEPVLFERSVPGRRAFDLPAAEVDEIDPSEVLPEWALRTDPAPWPEVSEPDVVRHYTRLSQWNFSIDSGMYPLGSCTMKYNPKMNEVMARLSGFAGLHPRTPTHLSQGSLELMHELEALLAAITGLDRVTLQPSAGAQGELTSILMIRAYHMDHHGTPRKKIIVPESAHGTNPASCAIAGYEIVSVPNGPDGVVHPQQLAEVMDDDVAALMLTNPNTLGLFEEHIHEFVEILRSRDTLLYMDGANMNALLGVARPGDMGVDAMHLNLHKTFSTPHGGGGPGAGPVAVSSRLAPYLPTPRVVHDGEQFRLDYNCPKSIGKLRTGYGNFGMFVRAYAYIRALGPEGLKQIAEVAVLNANYIKEKLKGHYHLPFDRSCMHEVVFTDKLQNEQGVKTLDVAKRLMDLGFHPPTVYFPLVVHGALMIEPTESEAKESLDQFIDAMRQIAMESAENPDRVTQAPSATFRRRLDETRAARKPQLRWNATH